MYSLVLMSLVSTLVQGQEPLFQRRTFHASDGTEMRYGIAIPRNYDPSRPRPLVLALHPGGERTPYYGDLYMRGIFFPGLTTLEPIMVAPDCPTPAWSDPLAEKAVTALIDDIIANHAIDRRRILVTGFSLGGAGTWFLSSRRPDLFTAAIVMAGKTDEPLERLAKIPTYVIHSRDDRVVAFDQAEERATALAAMGRAVRFDALSGVGHFEMPGYLEAIERAGKWVREQWAK